MTVKERITVLLESLNKGMYERDNEIKLALLSSIAGESIFLLGPPGVAKSLVARKLKFAYKDAKVFEYLMNRFSTPDEIFGPVSISKLKNEDKYERIVESYLPAADVVFLDEIWKAGPSIQNALLTAINEKLFRNGATEIEVPMKALISASNELPAKDQGLEALWDRFLVRLYVDGINNKDNFNKMISEKLNAYDDTTDINNKITKDEYETWDKEIDGIIVPENVFNVIHAIKVYIVEYNKKEDNKENQIYISDRRWRKILRLMRTSAFLNGRKDVDLMDCFLIKHCIWNEKQQIEAVSGFVNDAIEKHGYSISFDFKAIQEELKEFQVEIDQETKFVKNTKKQILNSVHNGYYTIQEPPNDKSTLIKISEYNSLSNRNKEMRLFYWHSSWGEVRVNDDYYSSYQIRKGNSNFTIFIDDNEYTLEYKTEEGKRQQTRKPNEYTEKAWDERIKNLFQHTEGIKSQIETYRNKDLEHLRVNLFVAPDWAKIVESHITATIKEIEKIEVSIREIQNGYKNLKNEDIVLENPKKKKGKIGEDDFENDEDDSNEPHLFFRL